LPLVPGFMVEVVEPGSPADKAGLKGGQLEVSIAGEEFLMGGDIITKIDGTPVADPARMIESLRNIKVGSNISLTISRDGQAATVRYVVPERPLLPGDVAGPNASFAPTQATSAGQKARLLEPSSRLHF